jgi:hypothetical protein
LKSLTRILKMVVIIASGLTAVNRYFHIEQTTLAFC